jgi:hypothetical protein
MMGSMLDNAVEAGISAFVKGDREGADRAFDQAREAAEVEPELGAGVPPQSAGEPMSSGTLDGLRDDFIAGGGSDLVDAGFESRVRDVQAYADTSLASTRISCGHSRLHSRLPIQPLSRAQGAGFSLSPAAGPPAVSSGSSIATGDRRGSTVGADHRADLERAGASPGRDQRDVCSVEHRRRSNCRLSAPVGRSA